MKKLFIRLLCCLVPGHNNRHKIHRYFLTNKHHEYIDYDRIARNNMRIITTAFLHKETFGPYKNKHCGQNVVLIAAGPTLNYFTPTIANSVYIGMNRTFIFDKVHFDYLFAIDNAGLDTKKESFYDGFMNYDCIKFIGDQNLGKDYQIPFSKYANAKNVYEYKTTAGWLYDKFVYDIDSQPLANSCSVAIQAMQFALYTNPKKVYIVGVDCTVGTKGHFSGSDYNNALRNEDTKQNDLNVIKSWKELKHFADIYYPETEIISVNPVGLKGVFKDVYTKSYLEQHPEIDINEVEIMES